MLYLFSSVMLWKLACSSVLHVFRVVCGFDPINFFNVGPCDKMTSKLTFGHSHWWRSTNVDMLRIMLLLSLLQMGCILCKLIFNHNFGWVGLLTVGKKYYCYWFFAFKSPSWYAKPVFASFISHHKAATKLPIWLLWEMIADVEYLMWQSNKTLVRRFGIWLQKTSVCHFKQTFVVSCIFFFRNHLIRYVFCNFINMGWWK